MRRRARRLAPAIKMESIMIAAVFAPTIPAGTGRLPARARASNLLSEHLVVQAIAEASPHERACRLDGWTPERIRTFLHALSQCGVVADAARAAGISKQSAYAFRGSARGRAFDVAWRAALLLARRRLADELMSRALNGCVELIIRDGEVWGERHRFDNRLTMAVLARLDQLAQSTCQADDAPRRVAHEFEAFVESVCAGGGEAADVVESRRRLTFYDFDEASIIDRNIAFVEGDAEVCEAADATIGEAAEPDEWHPSTSSTSQAGGEVQAG